MELNKIIDHITTLHDKHIAHWKKSDISLEETGLLRIILENHAFNYQLWNAEDKARRDDRGFKFVYDAKRKIDAFNQQRNNCMEKIDAWLYHKLTPTTNKNCPVHSETPGMMIDRLSILALKAFHMREQTTRQNTSEEHIKTCKEKLCIISRQREQLLTCLRELIDEVTSQKRTFYVYHQFKMYNDPALNPELY